MPMNADVLSTAMRAAMLATPVLNAVDGPALTALCNAIATTVVTHIVTTAVVIPSALMAPPGARGGPVTGTGRLT